MSQTLVAAVANLSAIVEDSLPVQEAQQLQMVRNKVRKLRASLEHVTLKQLLKLRDVNGSVTDANRVLAGKDDWMQYSEMIQQMLAVISMQVLQFEFTY